MRTLYVIVNECSLANNAVSDMALNIINPSRFNILPITINKLINGITGLTTDSLIFNTCDNYNILGCADFNSNDFIRNKLNMYASLSFYDIPHPKTIHSRSNISTCFWSSILRNVGIVDENSTKVAIRSSSSARSMGNLILPIDKIKNFRIFEFHKFGSIELNKSECAIERYKPVTDKIEELGIVIGGRGECRDDEDKVKLERSLANCDLLYQKFIDVKEEYRIYCHTGCASLDDCMVVKRNGYGLNVFEEDMKEEYLSIAEFKETNIYKASGFDSMIIKIFNMLKDLKMLTASLDIYLDNNDNVGVFEFSNEYLTDGVPDDMLLKFSNTLSKYLYEVHRQR